MCALLMTSRKGAMGVDNSTLIRMKTPTGFHLIGFGSQEVGAYYVCSLGLNALIYDFVELAAVALPESEQNTEQVVFFRSEHDVDVHLEDRSRFPYKEFQLTCRDLQKG